MVIGPNGAVISNTLRDEEGIIYADIDISQNVIPKQFHDVVGYYNRFDVFEFSVNDRALQPLTWRQAAGPGWLLTKKRQNPRSFRARTEI